MFRCHLIQILIRRISEDVPFDGISRGDKTIEFILILVGVDIPENETAGYHGTGSRVYVNLRGAIESAARYLLLALNGLGLIGPVTAEPVYFVGLKSRIDTGHIYRQRLFG